MKMEQCKREQEQGLVVSRDQSKQKERGEVFGGRVRSGKLAGSGVWDRGVCSLFESISFKKQASQVVLVVKNPPANVSRRKRSEFDPWVGKIPWRRKWQPTPVFLPGESYGQRSLVGFSP